MRGTKDAEELSISSHFPHQASLVAAIAKELYGKRCLLGTL